MSRAIILLFFLGACAPRPVQYLRILGAQVTEARMDGDELRMVYLVHVTKNCKYVRIFYFWRQNEAWTGLDYVSDLPVPASARRQATYSVGIGDTLWVNRTSGKIKALIRATNAGPDEMYGASVEATDILDLSIIYHSTIASK